MVAFDPDTNAQIGWTLMCSQSAIRSDSFAFLPLMPSKEKTGLIAAVGVDKSARGKGVGLALVVNAMENMRERGIEGVYVDFAIRDFYEKFGFEVFWESVHKRMPYRCSCFCTKFRVTAESNSVDTT
jgi:beta-N-acetylhexosaminidase